jgi:GT2 family glycosyltransferase
MRSRKSPVTDVSALVVNFNGERTLNKAVASLVEQTARPDRIVVVDNASSDASVVNLETEFPEVTILRLDSNRGLPAARNAGLQLLNSRYVVTLDNDIYLETNCVERLIDAARATDASISCPRFVLLPGKEIVQADGAEIHFLGVLTLRRGFTPTSTSIDERLEVGAASGGCYCIDRHRIPDVGLFDDIFFFYFEDLEFSLRMRSQGHRIMFDSSAIALHDRGQGTEGLAFRGEGSYPGRRAYLTMRNRWLTIAIHYQVQTIVVLAPALLVYEISALIIALMRGWGGEWYRACRWLVLNRQEVRTRRSAAREKRIIGDRSLLCGGPIPFSPGFLRSGIQRTAATMLSLLVNGYWLLARHFIR